MHKVIYSVDVENDLKEIRAYIAQDNKFYAQKVIEQVLGFINGMLAMFPLMGKENEKTGDREITESTFRYKILYRFDGSTVTVLNVFKHKNEG